MSGLPKNGRELGEDQPRGHMKTETATPSSHDCDLAFETEDVLEVMELDIDGRASHFGGWWNGVDGAKGKMQEGSGRGVNAQ